MALTGVNAGQSVAMVRHLNESAFVCVCVQTCWAGDTHITGQEAFYELT